MLRNRTKKRHTLAKLLFGLGLILIAAGLITRKFNSYNQTISQSNKSIANLSKKIASTTAKSTNKSVMRTPIDWQKSSQTTAYPDLKSTSDLWILVKLRANRTYLKSGSKTIYTMYSSGGKYRQKNGQTVSYTPIGTYYVQNERGKTFYNASLNEGANYWVSFLNHGEYLFHTVPIDSQGNYKKDEAAKLGKEPASHGCIRLSIPDAKYLYENLPVNTRVVIQN
ncbi:L,D-transpeptidase catalytic domain [Ligilactobacillus sp. WC1T17]|uniref:L,D-transpeptidase catalytic domain n=1 Tax=Ligilactobacillus ruminis TaxID=1623 RepID=A0ABY1AB68_9LACO|nr:L,D-transpeptidase catalytic domain [Ligilactobacillus ruminis]